MGQPITVTQKSTSRPDVLRFELNRSLTGTGHERYRSLGDVLADRPPDRVARKLLARPGVEEVHVYSNEVTVHLASPEAAEGILGDIEGLFIHYREGVVPSIV